MGERVCVGAIAGAFGVRGDVRLKSFCAEPDAIGDYSPLTTEDGSRSFDVTLDRPIKNGFAARISGVTSKEAAESLKGTRLYIPRDRLPAPDDDEYYHADLINLSVVDTGGTALGRVKAVLNHGASDLLEIALKGRSDTVLLPFTRQAVPTVDVTAGRIVADPPDGLFPDE
ncbi:16S rRNA processing protein RimM [Palleronia salina]|uniref:Ribosome maturation factor RimM n=2 Tax=Palleronia TaxID=315422 RepID=A0A1M6HN00_9RHOB|nr:MULTISPECIES: ribosome maturation factor RimM [Palleronia]SEM73537.1 16S rRNA processing protein RimM [Palleronia pelagia]SHJ23550.1 16S rRNA processing protein RimM [Palleronia salina]